MTITAKFPATCAVCDKPIAAGDQIKWRKGEKARHVLCASYYEIAAGGDKIGFFARSFAEAKAGVERLVAVGCDAEYCADFHCGDGLGECKKEHYHTINCRCPDCIANDQDDVY